jgi:DNA-binding response OmpR family regulator
MMGSTRGKVLVVDDDIVALEVAKERLERAGFTVITRSTALGTSACIKKEKPKCVLLDVQMPGLSGDALAKLLQGASVPSSVILHSASDRAALTSLASSCGAVGVIEKTDDDRYFLAQFENCLRRTGT